MGRLKRHKGATRDPGGFLALPWAVLDSEAYRGLSHPARALLLEVARQFNGDDNGRMLLSRTYLEPRGWKSADVIQRAKAELVDAGLIFQTVMGHRPNRASWYAVTWMPLDKLDGFDPGAAATFERSAYRNRPAKNASLIPSHGTGTASIAPSHGTGGAAAVPSRGAIRSVSGPRPVPPDGHPLEKPSPVVRKTEGEKVPRRRAALA